MLTDQDTAYTTSASPSLGSFAVPKNPYTPILYTAYDPTSFISQFSEAYSCQPCADLQTCSTAELNYFDFS